MVNAVGPFLNASEAARRLGVSVKALRIYEQRGLLTPPRSAAGYRVYGPDEMCRAQQIVSLRALGLGLEQVARVLEGEPRSLERALANHEATLDSELRRLVNTIAKVRSLRDQLARGQAPAVEEAGYLPRARDSLGLSFELPWPWGGERFEYRDIRAINYIVGPLGSGKTRLAQRIAETLPGASYLGLERLDDASDALTALLAGLEVEGPSVIVVDMVEQGLDRPTQEALITHLRERARLGARPLFLMTRSSSILDLAAVGADESILLCPANHSTPLRVTPYPGAPGYEAVATCLAPPEVRARVTGGVRLASAQ